MIYTQIKPTLKLAVIFAIVLEKHKSIINNINKNGHHDFFYVRNKQTRC